MAKLQALKEKESQMEEEERMLHKQSQEKIIRERVLQLAKIKRQTERERMRE